MLNLENLPTEIEIKFLEACPDLAFVNCKWYQLNNLLYRDRCLSLRPPKYWEENRVPICRYIKSLDRARKASRLINVRGETSNKVEGIEYMSDSWQIIYHVMFANPKFFNMDWINLNLYSQSLEPERPGFGGEIELLSNSVYQCNLWIRVKSVSARLRALRSVISSTGFESEWGGLFVFLDKSLPLHIEDWSKSIGSYCINMGSIETRGDTNSSTRQLKKLQAIVLGVEDDRDCETMEIIGFDFVPYQSSKKWVLFHTQDEELVFNHYEQELSMARMDNRWMKNSETSCINTFPFYDRAPKCQYIFKYPKDKQDDNMGSPNFAFPYIGRVNTCKSAK